jgi:hypothetical protein
MDENQLPHGKPIPKVDHLSSSNIFVSVSCGAFRGAGVATAKMASSYRLPKTSAIITNPPYGCYMLSVCLSYVINLSTVGYSSANQFIAV